MGHPVLKCNYNRIASIFPEFGLKAEVLLARAGRLEPPPVRLAPRQVGDDLQVGGGDQVGVGKVGSGGGGGGLDARFFRAQLLGDEVEGALVNLAGKQRWMRERGRCFQVQAQMISLHITSAALASSL